MKTLLIVLFFSFSVYAQQEKFIIGVDWLNPHLPIANNNFVPLSENYWNLAKSFGINYGALNFNPTQSNNVTLINNELQKAYNKNINVFLRTSNKFPDTPGDRPVRWMYQVEDNYDFNSHDDGQSVFIFGDDAEPHWSQVNVNRQAPNFWELKKIDHSAGDVAYDLKNKTEIPDNTGNNSYYVKLRIRKTQVLGGTNPVVKVIITNTTNNIPEVNTIYANELTTGVWTEKFLFSFKKTSIGPEAPTDGDDNQIEVEGGEFTGVADYEFIDPVYTPYDIRIYWYGLIDCDLDYVVIENKTSYDLHNGVHDNKINTIISNYGSNPALGNIKVADEPFHPNFLPIRYVKNKITELQSLTGNQHRGALSWHPLFWHYLTQQYLAQTQLDILLSNIYPIPYYKDDLITPFEVPGDANYTSAIQNRFNDQFIRNNNDEGLRRAINTSKLFTKPFWFTPQAHEWAIQPNQCSNPNDPSNAGQMWHREPSAYEIKSMVNIGICYGVKGILYFMYSKPEYKICSGQVQITAGKTLLNDDSHDNPVPRLKDNYNYDKWETVKQLNHKLADIGDELLSLTWNKAYSIHKGQPGNGEYITNVQSYYLPYAESPAVPDPSGSTYVELGLFKKSDDLNNPNLEHFFIVNRRTLILEGRIIRVNIDKSQSNFQNWVVREVGTNNLWNLSQIDYFETFFEPGEGKLFRLEPALLSGGILTQNLTIPIDAVINIASDLIVSQGISLTISNGANLFFNNGSSLIVHGNLYVNGTSSNKVTFDFISANYNEQNGIIVNTNSDLTLEYVEIKNAWTGLTVNETTPYINYAEVTNCNTGIYMYKSDYIISEYQGSRILNSDISANQTGIYLNESSPQFISNNISSNNIAIEMTNESAPVFGEYLEPGVNTFSANEYNIIAIRAYPILGAHFSGKIGEDYVGGFNQFTGSSYQFVSVDDNGYVMAELNWWDGSPPDPNMFDELRGTIDYDPWLDNPSSPLKGGGNENNSVFVSGNTNIYNKILIDIAKNDISSAWRLLKNKLNDSPSMFGIYLLKTLEKRSELSDSSKIIMQQISLKNSLDDETRDYAKLSLINKRGNNNFTGQLNQTANSIQNINVKGLALFKLFSHYYFSENDKESANQVLNRMKTVSVSEKWIAEAEKLLGNYQLVNNQNVINNNQVNGNEITMGNYPNPFNPITNINFNLPEISLVELTVYNILGQKVVTLKNEILEAGSYSVPFDATQLPSGVYIYTLRAGSFNKSAKMLLLK